MFYENRFSNPECFHLGLNEVLDKEEYSDYSIEIYAYYYVSQFSALVDEESWHIIAGNAHEAKEQLDRKLGSGWNYPLYDVEIEDSIFRGKILFESCSITSIEELEDEELLYGKILIYIDENFTL